MVARVIGYAIMNQNHQAFSSIDIIVAEFSLPKVPNYLSILSRRAIQLVKLSGSNKKT